MNVSRDVILDLLPMYHTDELSSDSRQLIEEYLAQDTELAKLVEKLGWNSAEIPTLQNPELKASALNRAKRLETQFSTFSAFGFVFIIVAVVFAMVGFFISGTALSFMSLLALLLFLVGLTFFAGMMRTSRELSSLD